MDHVWGFLLWYTIWTSWTYFKALKIITFCHKEGIKDCLEVNSKLCFQRKRSAPKVASKVYGFLPTVFIFVCNRLARFMLQQWTTLCSASQSLSLRQMQIPNTLKFHAPIYVTISQKRSFCSNISASICLLLSRFFLKQARSPEMFLSIYPGNNSKGNV